MSRSPQQPDTPSPSNWGGLWHKIWSPKIAPKPSDVSDDDPETAALDDTLTPTWDNAPAVQESQAGDPSSQVPSQPFGQTTTDAQAGAEEEVPNPRCPVCTGRLAIDASFCADCGYVVPPGGSEADAKDRRWEPVPTWHERFLPQQPLPCRPGVQRWLAQARQSPERTLVEVYYSLDKPSAQSTEETGSPGPDDDTVNLQAPLSAHVHAAGEAGFHSPTQHQDWPGAKWLHGILTRAQRGLPELIEYSELGHEQILVLRPPQGRSLWDAWDDPEQSLGQQFGWLRQIAEIMRMLHGERLVVEALRPEMFVVSPEGYVSLSDLSELLPLPIPPGVQMKGSLSTAPELVLAPELVGARADLYPFGALIYALHHGRELTEMDFDAHGIPRSFITVFPDAHPLLTRIVMKSFTRHIENRFPTLEDDLDPSGFIELITQLEAGERSANNLRLDVSGWSSTGIVRSTNEDAFGIDHAAGYGDDHWGDQALVILADGMGGCNAGEVASALAIKHIRETLSGQHPFPLPPKQDHAQSPGWKPEEVAEHLKSALQVANSIIHSAAEQGDGSQIGMGCTCEAALVSRGHLILGHVGDSRTYLYRRGQVKLLTQDQTMVNRMVTLGHLSAAEAENHPRRHELDQALGSSRPIEVQIVTESLLVGDILLFCSDGLTTHVNDRQIAEVLRNTNSAETAARRLVNLANALGGSDNVTVVIVRVA